MWALCIATEQYSSVGGGAGVICLGVVHMEEGVQVGVQVEMGREEQGEGETHGKEQSEEQRSNEKQSTAHHGWHEDDMSARYIHWAVLSQMVSMYRIMRCKVHEKNDVLGVSVHTPRR